MAIDIIMVTAKFDPFIIPYIVRIVKKQNLTATEPGMFSFCAATQVKISDFVLFIFH